MRSSLHRAAWLLVVLVLVAPPLARGQVKPLASFAAAGPITSAEVEADTSRVALDAQGTAYIMWVRLDGANLRVQTRTRSSAGALGPVQTLSSAGQDAFSPEMAVNPRGDAVFVWLRSDGTNTRVQIRARSPEGSFSAVQTVSPAGREAFAPAVAIDANGRAVVTWQGHDGTFVRIQARARSLGGALGAVQTLSPPGEHGWQPQIAIDSSSTAVITWYRNDGAHYRVQMRVRSVGGSLGVVQNVSPAGGNAQDPRVAMAPDGTAIFTWHRRDGANVARIQARARSASGEFSDVQTLSAAGQDASRPRVAIDADGNAVVSWERSDGTDVRVQTRSRSAAGVLSAIQTLSPAGAGSSQSNVAVDALGNAVFVWEHFDGTTALVRARVRFAAGTVGSVRTLGSSAEEGTEPVVAVEPDGGVIVVWGAVDATGWRVHAATGIVP
jgi:hypothetical protein